MKAVVGFIAVLFFLYFANPAFAAAQVSVDSLPLTIDQLQEFEIDINFLCPSCSDSYLRGVFYPSGSSYFGYTQDNSGNWVNATGGNCTSYYKISLSDLSKEGTWSGKLKIKPDIENSFYNGPGEYLFKVGRYTPSCGSPTWSSEKTIAITGPTPTPTSTPTPTPAPTSTPTSTSTPTPTKAPTPTPTLKPIASPTPEEILPIDKVLGESTESGIIVSPTATQSPDGNILILNKPKNANNNWFQKISISIGGVLLIACAIMFFRRRFKEHEN